MRRKAAEYGLLLASLIASPSAVASTEPPAAPAPEVTGPVVEGPGEPADTTIAPGTKPKPAEPAPAATKPQLSPRPLLIIPGMPNSRNSAKPRPVEAQPAPHVTLSGPLPIDSPVRERADSLPDAPGGHSTAVPLTLESIPDDDAQKKPAEVTKRPKETTAKPLNPRSSPLNRPNPNLRRPSSMLGRFFPPASRGRWEDGDEGIHVDSKSDPAADAAVKRRVEKQIRESVGSKVKTFDVRVVGRQIAIRAQAARFWQKRSTRTAIEGLPALTGYKSFVEMID